MDGAEDVLDFSTVDFTYHRAQFSLTIDATPFTDRHEFPAITPYHTITVLRRGETHLYAVGIPLSILGECILFQVFARDETAEGRFVIPGILRVMLRNTYFPSNYPSPPPPSMARIDAVDPTWNLILPSNRVHGWIQFPSQPVGKESGIDTHVFAAMFDDELIRERFKVARHGDDPVGGGSSVTRAEGGRSVQGERFVEFSSPIRLRVYAQHRGLFCRVRPWLGY